MYLVDLWTDNDWPCKSMDKFMSYLPWTVIPSSISGLVAHVFLSLSMVTINVHGLTMEYHGSIMDISCKSMVFVHELTMDYRDPYMVVRQRTVWFGSVSVHRLLQWHKWCTYTVTYTSESCTKGKNIVSPKYLQWGYNKLSFHYSNKYNNTIFPFSKIVYSYQDIHVYYFDKIVMSQWLLIYKT